MSIKLLPIGNLHKQALTFDWLPRHLKFYSIFFKKSQVQGGALVALRRARNPAPPRPARTIKNKKARPAGRKILTGQSHARFQRAYTLPLLCNFFLQTTFSTV